MVANTRKPRTGMEICVGQNMPAFTAHLVHKYGGADAVGFSKTLLAAEIDANNLRVRIEELSMAVEMAEKHCDDDTARSLADRHKKLSLQLDALINGDPVPVVKTEEAPQLAESVATVSIRHARKMDFQIINAIKLLRSYSHQPLGLREAKDFIEAVHAAAPKYPADLSVQINCAEEFTRVMATIGYEVADVAAAFNEMVRDGFALPPQDSQTFFNVRIRWMKWTGKAPEMQDLIKTHTDKDGSIQHINDAIHSGGVGGCGAVFPKITIRDFATFCRKAEEYGYEVELVEAPVAEEANPFVVRAPA